MNNFNYQSLPLHILALTGSIELHHLYDHLCNQKMFDVLWKMDDVIPLPRKMDDGRTKDDV